MKYNPPFEEEIVLFLSPMVSRTHLQVLSVFQDGGHVKFPSRGQNSYPGVKVKVK